MTGRARRWSWPGRTAAVALACALGLALGALAVGALQDATDPVRAAPPEAPVLVDQPAAAPTTAAATTSTTAAALTTAGPATSVTDCLLYTSPSPRDGLLSRMPSSA